MTEYTIRLKHKDKEIVFTRFFPEGTSPEIVEEELKKSIHRMGYIVEKVDLKFIEE